jgi:hypothetical protein
MANNWGFNPVVTILRTHLSRILNERYPKHDNLVERIGSGLTQADTQLFGSLIADIYETGYFKAMGDYEKELRKLGYKVNLTSEAEKISTSIFK